MYEEDDMKTTLEDWPYPKPDEGDDLGLAITIAAIAGHDHLHGLATYKMQLAKIHALYHITGNENTKEHDLCLQYSEQVDGWAERALRGVWN